MTQKKKTKQKGDAEGTNTPVELQVGTELLVTLRVVVKHPGWITRYAPWSERSYHMDVLTGAEFWRRTLTPDPLTAHYKDPAVELVGEPSVTIVEENNAG